MVTHIEHSVICYEYSNKQINPRHFLPSSLKLIRQKAACQNRIIGHMGLTAEQYRWHHPNAQTIVSWAFCMN
jgi:hypothetical protein